MKAKKKNSLGKRILSTVLAAATALSGFTFSPLSSVTTAEAASSTLTKSLSSFDEIGDQIVYQALSYLGCGYTEASHYRTGLYTDSNGTRYFDCSGLVYRIYQDIGFTMLGNGDNNLWNTYNWRKAAQEHTVDDLISYTGDLDYNGVVYVSNLEDYNDAVTDSANVGKLIVLDTAVSTAKICADADLNPGTIIVTEAPTDGEAHAMIVIDQYESTSTSSSYATKYYEYYNTVMNSINSKYGLSLSNARVFAPSGISVPSSYSLTTSTTAAYDGAVYTSSDNYPMYSGSSSYYMVVNGSFSQSTNSLGNTTWVVEASHSGAGVRISNLVGAKGGTTIGAYLIGTPTKSYYAKIGIEKVQSTSFTTDVSGAVYAMSESLSQLNTLAGNTYSSAAAAKSAANSVSGVSAVTTSSSGAVNFSKVYEWNASEGQTKTFYVKEIYSPTGYDTETGYYAVTVKGTTDTDGLASTITGISAKNISGSNYNTIVNSTSSASYIKVADVKTKYSGTFTIKKTNSDGGACWVSGIKFNVYTNMACTEAADTATLTTDSYGEATYPVFEMSSATSERVFYIKEDPDTVPDGMTANTDVYRVVVKAGEGTDGSNCSIAVTHASTGALAAESGAATAGVNNTTITFNFPNPYKTYKGMFTITKTDQAGNTVKQSGIVFNVYQSDSGSIATDSYGNYIAAEQATMTTNSSGVATYSGFSWTANTNGTNNQVAFYVHEDASSVPSNMEANDNWYRVVITASETGYARDCTISVWEGSSPSTTTTKVATYSTGYGYNNFHLSNTQKYYGTFAVQKTDENGVAVTESGIQFEVYSSMYMTSASLVTTITTDADGVATFPVFEKSSTTAETRYYVKEVASSVPAGMEVNTNVYCVRVYAGEATDGSDSTITVTYGATGSEAYNNGTSVSTTSNTYTFAFPNQSVTYTGSFAVQKVDENGNKVKVSGITFNVYTNMKCTEAAPTPTITTDANGVAAYTTIDFTYSGQEVWYYVVEDPSTVPAGMTASTEVYRVKITAGTQADGSDAVVSVTKGATGTEAYNSTDVIFTNSGNSALGITFPFENTLKTVYGTFTIQKTDNEGNALDISGIDFEIYTAMSMTSASYTTTITTDADGVATFSYSKTLNAKGTNGTVRFYVKEVADTVPDNYEVNTNVYLFEMTLGEAADGSDATITVRKGTTGSEAYYSTTYLATTGTNGLTFAFPNVPKTDFTVKKVLDTATGTDKLVDSVTVELYADGAATGNTTVLDDTGNWTYTWKNLDKYSDDDNTIPITYTAKEISVQLKDQYDSATVYSVTTGLDTVFTVETKTADGTTVVTNTINTTTLNVVKDFGTDTESRISKVVVELYRNNAATGEKLELTTGSWTGAFTNLVKYDPDGNAYSYTAKEVSVTYTDMWGAEHTVTDANVIKTLFNTTETTDNGTTTITNTFAYTTRAVQKSFDTVTGSRLVQITTSLYADGTAAPFAEKTLNSANSWYDAWTGLDKYDYEGNLITYTVKETTATYTDMDGYEYTVKDNALVTLFNPTVDDDADETKSEIVNNITLTGHTAVKEFSDDTESRVQSVTVELYRNDTSTGRTAVLNSTNGWTCTWDGLDMYDSTGTAYTYKAVETGVAYMDDCTGTVVSATSGLNTVFTVELTQKDNETIIKNTINTVDVPVKKEFGTDTESRVQSVTLELYRNDTATGKTIVLNTNNSWSGTFEGLIKYDASGTAYDYTVKEVSVTYTDMWGTEHTVTDTAVINKIFAVSIENVNGTLTVTDTIRTTDYTVSKFLTGIVTKELVKGITAVLYADGVSYSSATLDDTNSWSNTWSGLDKFDYKGNEISYSAKETEVKMLDDYDATVTYVITSAINTVFDVNIVTSANETQIYNSVNTAYLNVEKTFGTDTESRISKVVVELYRNNAATGETLELTTGSWTGAFANLVKYDPDGNEYSYTVKEISVTYTDMWGTEHTVTDESIINKLFKVETSSQNGTATVKNTFNYVSREVIKTFTTALAESNIQSVTTSLYANGSKAPAKFTDLTLSSSNTWAGSWTGLDMYDYEGNLITYTAKETSATYKNMDGTVYTAVNDALVKIFEPAVDDNYTSTGSKIENNYITTEYTVTKEFGDNTESRVDSVTVELYRNDTATGRTATLSSANGWSYTWTELDKYDNSAAEYKYSAVETGVSYADDYTGTVSTVTGTKDTVFTIEITPKTGETVIKNTINTTSLTAVKSFGADTESRISEVVVELYRNNDATGVTLVLNAANSWADTFTNLVQYDPDGKEYSYTAKEISVTYTDMWGDTHTVTDTNVIKTLFDTTEVTDNGVTTITNTFAYTKRTVVKTFVTGSLAQQRIQKITTSLYANGSKAPDKFAEITLNADNTWFDEWTGLDKYDYEGNLITYTVKETSATYKNMDGTVYTAVNDALVKIFEPGVDNNLAATDSKIENNYISTKHTVIKTFGDVVTEERVINVVAELYRNDEATGRTVTLDESNSWAYTWTDLDMYDNDGEVYKYNAVEVSVTYTDIYGEEQTITGEMLKQIFNSTAKTVEKVTLLTNTLETVEHEVAKAFTTDAAKADVEYITMQLYAGDTAIGDTASVNEENGWQHTWSNLDKYAADGTEITYTVKEILINGKTTPTADNGYIVSYDNSNTTITTVTNDTTKVEITKTDITGSEEIEGATLTIYEVDEESNRTEVETWVSTDEPHYIEKLGTGNYVLVEEYAPENYAKANEIEFTVTDTAEIQKVTMVDDLQKGRIAVMKKGLAAVGTTKIETVYGDVEKLVYDYIYLPGVEFTIYADEDLTEVIAKITTDDDGVAYSDYLVVGTYYAQETFTPAGYVADDTVYTVNITGDGTGSLYVLDVTKDIVNHPCSATISIYKEGSYLVSAEKGYEEKTIPLEGVVIGIFAAENIVNYLGTTVIGKDTLIAVLVTDEDGLATMTETLPAGSYYYRELKALDGYVLDETEHEFSVSYENDNVTLEVNKENPLVNYIKSGTLTVNKVDQNGDPLGAGVWFLVTCTNTGETWTVVTNADGIATLGDLSIGAYDENGTWVYYTYTLQETKTLENYRLDDTVYTWQFTADNTNAEAVYQSFTVRNVILGIVDYSEAGGVGMLMLALVFVLMAVRKKKEPSLE